MKKSSQRFARRNIQCNHFLFWRVGIQNAIDSDGLGLQLDFFSGVITPHFSQLGYVPAVYLCQAGIVILDCRTSIHSPVCICHAGAVFSVADFKGKSGWQFVEQGLPKQFPSRRRHRDNVGVRRERGSLRRPGGRPGCSRWRFHGRRRQTAPQLGPRGFCSCCAG